RSNAVVVPFEILYETISTGGLATFQNQEPRSSNGRSRRARAANEAHAQRVRSHLYRHWGHHRYGNFRADRYRNRRSNFSDTTRDAHSQFYPSMAFRGG